MPDSGNQSRLEIIRRHSDNPDIAVLLQELDTVNRTLHETQLHVESLKSEIEEKSGEIDALKRVGEATGSALDLEEMLKIAAGVATEMTGTDSCQVYIFDKTRQALVLRAADESAENMIGKIKLKLGEGITGWVARERKPVAVGKSASQDHRFRYFPEIKEEDYESILSVPLVAKNEMFGVINVRTRLPHDYTRAQVRLLSGIASQVAGAIEKTRKARAALKTSVQISTLSEVSQAIASNVYIDEVLHLFVELTAKTMNYKIVTVLLVDKERGELIMKATQAKDVAYTKKPRPKIGESIAGQAVQEKHTIVVADVRKHPGYLFPDVAAKAGICSLASVPMLIQGNVIGVLNCYTEKLHTFTPEELAILSALATQAAFAVEHAKLTVKSAVIQEMHHRVKNNLQQIVSLVRLQTRFSSKDTAHQALGDTLNRILAIAAVHELLSRDDLDTVSVKKMAEQILIGTKQSVVAPDKHLYTVVEGTDIQLPLDQATSLALVINELVQNAVEHGFANQNEGRIVVTMEQSEEEFCVTVKNDGQPLPDDFDASLTPSLGLRIVTDLVRGGLGGTFTMRNQDGIAAIVCIPRSA